jgi:hypothetical protein
MASRNFTQFISLTEVTSGDYLVGYNAAATNEIRITISKIFEKVGFYFVPESLSINTIQGNNSTTGSRSFIGNGQNNVASGTYSFGIGNGNIAEGISSFVGGSFSQASNQNSFAFGNEVIAEGNNSHAEGDVTKALGLNSHAEGSNTVAEGRTSHAQNEETVASGRGSHAQGNLTEASGEYSTAYGVESYAQADNSVAGGNWAIAAHNLSWIWRGSDNFDDYTYTTRDNQFMVSASGGICLGDKVGIGTDSIDNALTVVGDISATGNLKLGTTVTPPSNTTTPVAWTDIYVNNVLYKLPLYQ